MTLSDLIEKLRSIPGDPDLLIVRTKVLVSRPYTEPHGTVVYGEITNAQRDSLSVTLDSWIYLE